MSEHAMKLQIDGAGITDWASFHDQFAERLGFPGFYGRNMNAWIDCMSYLDDPSAGMSSVCLMPGEVLTLCISDATGLQIRCPEIFQELVDCTASVNDRRAEQGAIAVLALAFEG